MKHILPILTAALLGVAAPVFAETLNFDGFSVETTPYKNQSNNGVGEGSYYTIKMNGAGSLFITNFIQPGFYGGIEGQTEFLTNSIYGITHYGYIDSKGKTHEFAIDDAKIKDQFDASPAPFKRDGYFLGNFGAGEEIQIYLARKDADGNVLVWTASNTPQPNANVTYTSRWGGRPDAADSSMPIGELYFPDGTPQINFGIIASTTRNIPGITDVAGGPVGSPLPGGVQIALIAGLFGLGFWYIRRRKAAVA